MGVRTSTTFGWMAASTDGVPDDGFTLIELLVVMIIIGILAAIAIPTFLNQRRNGYNTAVKTDLGNLGLAFESSAVDAGGDYTQLFAATKGKAGDPVAVSGVLTAATFAGGVQFSGTQNVNLTMATDATSTSFCVYGWNTSVTGTYWLYSRLKGGLQPTSYPDTATAAAAC